jgi:hypothetical protein
MSGVTEGLFKLGLGTPGARAFAAFTVTSAWCYTAKYPEQAFTDEGGFAPFKLLSKSPDATYQHFLLLPVGLAVTAYLFT